MFSYDVKHCIIVCCTVFHLLRLCFCFQGGGNHPQKRLRNHSQSIPRPNLALRASSVVYDRPPPPRPTTPCSLEEETVSFLAEACCAFCDRTILYKKK